MLLFLQFRHIHLLGISLFLLQYLPHSSFPDLFSQDAYENQWILRFTIQLCTHYCWCSWEYHRQYVLWSCVFRVLLPLRYCRVFTRGRRLCRLFTGVCGGYVLFPDDRHPSTIVDTIFWWRQICFLQTSIQYCRLGNIYRRCLDPDILQIVFPKFG